MNKIYWKPWVKTTFNLIFKLGFLTLLINRISDYIKPWCKNIPRSWIYNQVLCLYARFYNGLVSIIYKDLEKGFREFKADVVKELLVFLKLLGSIYVNIVDSPKHIGDWYINLDKKDLRKFCYRISFGILIFIPSLILGQHIDSHGTAEVTLGIWEYASLLVFVLVIAGLFFEEKVEHLLKANKTWVVVTGAFVMGMICFFSGNVEHFTDNLAHASRPMWELVGFLFFAMWIVEHISRQGGINYISKIIIGKSSSERVAFTYLFFGVFLLSPWIDNVLAAIMGYTLTTILFPGEKKKTIRILVTAAVIISSNAGGAFFPTGDPPVLLAWIAKVLAVEDMIKYMAVPSILFSLPMYLYVLLKLDSEALNVDSSKLSTFKNSGKMFFLGIISIMLIIPLRMTYPDIPPYLALMGSFSLFWMISTILNSDYTELVAPREKMPEYMAEGQQIEFVTVEKVKLKNHLNMLRTSSHIDTELLGFFIGLLTCIGILEINGVLTFFADFIDNNVSEQIKPLVYGASSSTIDNVAMQAATLSMYADSAMSLIFWVKTTFYICVGGCYLITGTASGVALMERSGLGMWQYIKLTIIPVTIGLALCELIWFRMILGW